MKIRHDHKGAACEDLTGNGTVPVCDGGSQTTHVINGMKHKHTHGTNVKFLLLILYHNLRYNY